MGRCYEDVWRILQTKKRKNLQANKIKVRSRELQKQRSTKIRIHTRRICKKELSVVARDEEMYTHNVGTQD